MVGIWGGGKKSVPKTESLEIPEAWFIFSLLFPLSRSFQPPTRTRDLTSPRIQAQQQQQEGIFVLDIEGTGQENNEEDGPSSPPQQSLNPNLTQRHRSCCRLCKYLCVVSSRDGSFWHQGRLFIHIYQLDNYSRVIFPVTFFIVNVLYWVICFNL